MKLDYDRIWTMLDIVVKAAQVGIPETSHIIAEIRKELTDVHAALADENAKAKAEADAKAAEDAAAKAKQAQAETTPPNSVPIESVPRDASGNIITQPRAVPANTYPADEPDPNSPPSPLRRP